MVVVEEVTKLSERPTQTSSEAFPDDSVALIRAAVEAVPASVSDGSTKHTEIGAFDAAIAEGLPQYEYEGDAIGGYNPTTSSGRIRDSTTALTATKPTPTRYRGREERAKERQR